MRFGKRLVLVLLAAAAAQASTIATFADPAADGSTPLFSIDLVADLMKNRAEYQRII